MQADWTTDVLGSKLYLAVQLEHTLFRCKIRSMILHGDAFRAKTWCVNEGFIK